jgi:hypothetical protein
MVVDAGVVALLLAVRGAAVLPVFFADVVVVPVPAVAREQQVAPAASAGVDGGAGSCSRHQAAGLAQSLSGGVRDPKLVPHPPGHARLGVGQRGIERLVAAAALPNYAAFIQNANKPTGLNAVADLDGSELGGPTPEMRI